MITKRLARRLADLDSRIQPAATIPTVIRFNFVEGDGTVVGHPGVHRERPGFSPAQETRKGELIWHGSWRNLNRGS
jgi:hypothetical protein